MKRFVRGIFTAYLCLLLSGNIFLQHADLYFKPIVISAAEQNSNPFPLILDCDNVDYMSYIPEISCSERIEEDLSIKNPKISIEAKSAVLIKKDGSILYHKNALDAVFPGSTTKLLTALVAVQWCDPDEKIVVGDEVKMIASDSSKAGLKKGEVLKFSTLLSAMLLPSGNDAAYVAAAYVGRKSLKSKKASCEKAVKEFARLMNEKAEELGAENSCFITPDGYDAIGQYTTAYDMAMIGLAVTQESSIMKVTKKNKITATIISGEKFTWSNTNQLINKDSNWYNEYVIGLKTGTTTMAGRCLISAAQNDKGTIISVVMNSTSQGRWNDSNKLLNYGLKKLK